MKHNSLYLPLLMATVLGCWLTGCGKKAPEASTTAPVSVPAAASVPEPAPAANPAAGAAAAPPAQLAESQAAISKGDFERAADALIAAKQAPLSPEQAEAVAAQMRQLQNNLASAVASGDARAKAAAAKLRASATVR